MRAILPVIVFFFAALTLPGAVRAEMIAPSVNPTVTAATGTAVATDSAQATPSATVAPIPSPKTDITQPTSEIKSQLERVMAEHPVGQLSWTNFLRYGVQQATAQGVPLNTVVLVLLFPLVVAIVAASRHLIGMRGAGILTPALLSVAFLATGVWAGVVLFAIILFVTSLMRTLLKRLKLQYLPRVALLLWFVSAGVLVTLFLSAYVNLTSLVNVGIFPILILMLLSETFIDIQQGRSAGEARDLIFQTFLLAMISSLLLAWSAVQQIVLLYPELVFFGVAVFDVFMGKYTGLRLTEYIMFKQAVKEDEEE